MKYGIKENQYYKSNKIEIEKSSTGLNLYINEVQQFEDKTVQDILFFEDYILIGFQDNWKATWRKIDLASNGEIIYMSFFNNLKK